jgi:DNA topoisomerase-1
MFEYYDLKRQEKKNQSNEEKKRMREDKVKNEEKFQYCLLDGRKEKVGNFRIEPPGLFRGRGDHPKTGKLKVRTIDDLVFRLTI